MSSSPNGRSIFGQDCQHHSEARERDKATRYLESQLDFDRLQEMMTKQSMADCTEKSSQMFVTMVLDQRLLLLYIRKDAQTIGKMQILKKSLVG